MKFTRFFSVAVALGAVANAAPGALVNITVENPQPSNGFFFTPLWVGFHDGNFDVFNTGSPASSELATLAETGNTAPLSGLFASTANAGATDTTLTGPTGAAGPFDPAESMTFTLDIPNPGTNQFMSFASMVIPSNDAFFGNGDPQAYRLFNADGSFAGPLSIDVSTIYDSGSEDNTGTGAAFSTLAATPETDQSLNVALHAGLGNFAGTGTAAGTTIGGALSGNIARITVAAVPEPTSFFLWLVGITASGCVFRRSRRV